MGISTDADLYYGIQLEEGFEFSWEKDENNNFEEWEDYYCHKFGIEYPEEEYSKDNPSIMGKYNKYWDSKNTLLKKAPCGIGMHCSYDYPMYCIVVKESYRHATRGNPVKIENTLNADPDWDSQLQEFCDIMNIEYEQPAWWLSSMYG